MTHYLIKIKLKNVPVAYYRTVLVPSDIMFVDLEGVIKFLMLWSGFHMSMFSIDNGRVEIAHPEAIDHLYSRGCLLPSDTERLCDYKDCKIEYIYDMGDYWQHSITIEKELEGDIPCPQLVKGRGFAFLEDTGGPYCFKDQEPDMGYFDKEDIEEFNNVFRTEYKPYEYFKKEEKEKNRTIPYNAVYSLSIAAFLPGSLKLYLDPVTGTVYSDKKNDYFPKAGSVSDLIEIGADKRYDIIEELNNTLREGGSIGPNDNLDLGVTDLQGLLEAKDGKYRFLLSEPLKNTMHSCAYRILEDLGLETSEEVLFEHENASHVSDIPFDLMMERNLCPSCGKVLSNPRPDTDSEMREYGSIHMYPILMTCTGCGKDTRIVPDEDTGGLTYEGFRSPLHTLKEILKPLEGKKNPKAKADVTFRLYLNGEKVKAVGMAVHLLRSTEPYCRAVASAILYPEGKLDDDAMRNVLSDSKESVKGNIPVYAILSAIDSCINGNDDHPKAIDDFIDDECQTFEHYMTAAVISSILPPDSGFQKEPSRILKEGYKTLPGYSGFVVGEEYFKSLIRRGNTNLLQKTEYVKNGDKKTTDPVTYTLSRYRLGILELDTDTEAAIKNLKGVINEVLTGLKSPMIYLRAAYAALIVHHLGVCYKNKDLIPLSVRWASIARDNGYLQKDDFYEYLVLLWRVGLEERGWSELDKLMRQYEFVPRYPAKQLEFDLSEIKEIMSQYRTSPY